MQSNDQVIEKIRKLLALGERGGTEAEAEAAMAKVQELLTKHNLDMDSVRKSDETTLINEHREYPWNQTWIRQAYMGIARLYFCKFYIEQYGTKITRCYLIGEPVNVQTAFYVGDVVVRTGNRLAKEFASAKREEFIENGGEPKDATGHAISQANGFKKGFGLRISARCNDLIREASTCNPSDVHDRHALVVADFYKNNQLMLEDAAKAKFGLDLSFSSGMRYGDRGAMGAGATAANGVNLRAAGISGGRANLLK